MPDNEIVNKVALSTLITLNLEDYYTPGNRVALDIAPQLLGGMLLREKDFREFVKNHDWESYSGKHVAVFCSTDALIPTWAYMLVAAALQPYAAYFVIGNPDALEQSLFQQSIAATFKPDEYKDAKVVLKGCGNIPVPAFAYTEIVRLLRPVAASVMYGEPCSTVPVYKRAKAL